MNVKNLLKDHTISARATGYLILAGLHMIALGLIPVVGPVYFPAFMLASPVNDPFWGLVILALFGGNGLLTIVSAILDKPLMVRWALGLTIALSVGWLASLVFVALAGASFPALGYYVFVAFMIAKNYIMIRNPLVVPFEDSDQLLGKKEQVDKTEELLKEVRKDSSGG